MPMPCQCTTHATADTSLGGCQCASESASGCECGTEALTRTDQESSLERIVMELDKRVRRLEASR
jgi:hypothetical protein